MLCENYFLVAYLIDSKDNNYININQEGSGRMAELVDAQDSKSCGSNAVRVRVSLCPPNK